MARLFTCGLEENATTTVMWTEFNLATIVTTPVHSGTYSARFNPAVTQHYATRNLSTAVTTGTYFVRFYFRYATFPANTNTIFNTMSSAAAAELGIRALVSGGNKLQLQNAVAGTTANGTIALSANTWYRIEVRHLLSDTVGEMELRLFLGDETTPLETLSLTAQDTLATNLQRFRWGVAINTTSDYFVDDIAVNNDTGTFQNSWPGPGKIALTEADGNVSVTWEGTGGTTNWDRIDDLPGAPDDATTYNSEVVNASSVDRLSLGTLPAEVTSDADMILLDMYMRVGSTATTARNITNKIWDEAGTLTNGPLISAAINGWRIPSIGPTDEHQVFDLGARTKANIEAFDVGYDNTASNPTRERRVTALWVQVEWIEAAPGGAQNKMRWPIGAGIGGGAGANLRPGVIG